MDRTIQYNSCTQIGEPVLGKCYLDRTSRPPAGSLGHLIPCGMTGYGAPSCCDSGDGVLCSSNVQASSLILQPWDVGNKVLETG